MEPALQDAQHDIRIELEPLAFTLAGQRAYLDNIPGLEGLVEKAALVSKAGDLSAFFESL
jgi:hypothetical protein